MIEISEFEESATMLAGRSTLVRVVSRYHGCEVQQTEEVCLSRSRTFRSLQKTAAVGQSKAILPPGWRQE